MTSIGTAAFSESDQLRSIIIPHDVKEIRSYTFFGCSNLESVSISNQITKIGDMAFSGCKKLKTIEIPQHANVSKNAFPQNIIITLIPLTEKNGISQEIKANSISKYDPQEWVDLNLPSKTIWAKVNIGAESIGDIGDYCTWEQSIGIALSKGGAVPTSEQFSELVKFCDWKWTSINGNEGYLVSSKKNPNNNIFLPIAGYYSNNGSRYLGSGFYWTKTRYPGNAGDACYFCFWQGYHGDFRVFYLDFRLSVRLVQKSSVTQ